MLFVRRFRALRRQELAVGKLDVESDPLDHLQTSSATLVNLPAAEVTRVEPTVRVESRYTVAACDATARRLDQNLANNVSRLLASAASAAPRIHRR